MLIYKILQSAALKIKSICKIYANLHNTFLRLSFLWKRGLHSGKKVLQ